MGGGGGPAHVVPVLGLHGHEGCPEVDVGGDATGEDSLGEDGGVVVDIVDEDDEAEEAVV